MRQRQPEYDSSSGGGLLYTAIVAAITLVTAFIIYEVCTVRIDPNERALKTRFGVIVDYLEPGLHWVNPMIEKVSEYQVDNRQLENAKHPANVYTVDNQEVNVIHRLIYQLPSTKEGLIFLKTEVGNYEPQIEGLALDRMKRALGKINNNSIAKERDVIVNAIEVTLKHDLQELYRIKLISYQMIDIAYTQRFREAVEKAAEAKAGIETEENKRLQAVKIAEQTEEKAKGEAKAYKLKTDAEAAGHLAVGLAKAQALEAEGRALQANPRLVEYEQAKRWTGSLPQYMGVGALPFMSLDAKALDKPLSR